MRAPGRTPSPPAPMNIPPTIFVVEPDSAMCEWIRSIASLLELRCETYATGQEFLEGIRSSPAWLPGAGNSHSGRERPADPEEARRDGPDPADDIPDGLCERLDCGACDADGAFHFLEKPFHEHDLWSAIQDAIHVDQERRKAGSVQERSKSRSASCRRRRLPFWNCWPIARKRRDGRGWGSPSAPSSITARNSCGN